MLKTNNERLQEIAEGTLCSTEGAMSSKKSATKSHFFR